MHPQIIVHIEGSALLYKYPELSEARSTPIPVYVALTSVTE